MSTHATIRIIENNKSILTLYIQYDGYLTGVWQQLANFLKDRKVVNGFKKPDAKISNGMGCLAASLVCAFKQETGNVYLVDNTEFYEYNYHICMKDNQLRVSVTDIDRKQLFAGNVDDFCEFCLP